MSLDIHVGRGVELVRWDAMQKAYEELCARRAGWCGLVSLVCWKVIMWFGGSRVIREDNTTTIIGQHCVYCGT